MTHAPGQVPSPTTPALAPPGAAAVHVLPYAYNTPPPYVSARGRARWAVASLCVVIALDVITALTECAELRLLNQMIAGREVPGAEWNSVYTQQQVVGAVVLGVGLVTTALLAVWLYRAYKNLLAFGQSGLRYSPAWAAGSWFVPIVNLFVPFRIVREAWRACDPATHPADPLGWQGVRVPPLLGWWWGVEILAVVAALTASGLAAWAQTTRQYRVVAWADLVWIAVAVFASLLAIRVVRSVQARQDAKHAASLSPPPLAGYPPAPAHDLDETRPI